MKMGAWSPLAVDRVRYVGDAVAVVVAETRRRPATRPGSRSPQGEEGRHRRGRRVEFQRAAFHRATTTSSTTGNR